MDYERDFYPLMTTLALNYQRELTDELLAAWWRAFKDANVAALIAAVEAHMRASDFFPRISEIAREADAGSDLTPPATRTRKPRWPASAPPPPNPRAALVDELDRRGADPKDRVWWEEVCLRLGLAVHWREALFVQSEGVALLVFCDGACYAICDDEFAATRRKLEPALLDRYGARGMPIRLLHFTGDEAGVVPALAAGGEGT